MVSEKKVLEVHVEKGMQHHQKIVFEGQADQAVCNIRFLFPSSELNFDHGFRRQIRLAGLSWTSLLLSWFLNQS